jgi:hypothetical protein
MLPFTERAGVATAAVEKNRRSTTPNTVEKNASTYKLLVS